MTDKTPPYVIDFDDIRKGMTIEVTYSTGTKLSFVASRKGWNATDWTDPLGQFAITPPGTEGQDPERVIRVLEEAPEPPKPALPTEGYIEAWGTPGFGADEMHLLIATLDGDGDWYGITEDGSSDFLTPNQITRWKPVRIVPADAPTAPKTDWQRWVDEAKRSDCGVQIDGIYIQTAERYWAAAPKADDGLRERVEVLAALWASYVNPVPSNDYARGVSDTCGARADDLHALLAETSAS